MTYTFNNWKLKSNYTGSKKAPWEGSPENWNHHTVTVTNTETGKHTYFDFWMSISDPEIKTEYDLMNAFRCFVDDAICGTYTFEEFCSEFGYDTDSRRAERIWKACQRSKKKLETIAPDIYLYDLLDSLEDYA